MTHASFVHVPPAAVQRSRAAISALAAVLVTPLLSDPSPEHEGVPRVVAPLDEPLLAADDHDA